MKLAPALLLAFIAHASALELLASKSRSLRSETLASSSSSPPSSQHSPAPSLALVEVGSHKQAVVIEGRQLSSLGARLATSRSGATASSLRSAAPPEEKRPILAYAVIITVVVVVAGAVVGIVLKVKGGEKAPEQPEGTMAANFDIDVEKLGKLYAVMAARHLLDEIVKMLKEIGAEAQGIDGKAALKGLLKGDTKALEDKLKAEAEKVQKKVQDRAMKALEEAGTEQAMMMVENATSAMPPPSVMLAGIFSPFVLLISMGVHLSQVFLLLLPSVALSVWSIWVDWHHLGTCAVPTIWAWAWCQAILAMVLAVSHVLTTIRIAVGRATIQAKQDQLKDALREALSDGELTADEMRELFMMSIMCLEYSLELEDRLRRSIWRQIIGVGTILWMCMTIWTLVIVVGWTFVPGQIAFVPPPPGGPPYCGAWATVFAARLGAVMSAFFITLNLISVVQWVCDTLITSKGLADALLTQGKKIDEGCGGVPVTQTLIKAFVLRGAPDMDGSRDAAKDELAKQMELLNDKLKGARADAEKAMGGKGPQSTEEAMAQLEAITKKEMETLFKDISEMVNEQLKQFGGIEGLQKVVMDEVKEAGMNYAKDVAADKLKEMGLGAFSGVAVDQLAGLASGNLDLEQLKAQGMALSSQMSADKLKELGLSGVSMEQLSSMGAQGFDLEALKAQGMGALSGQGLDLEALKAQGMGALSSQGLDVEALKAQGMGALSSKGLDLEALKAQGMGALSAQGMDLEALKAQGMGALSAQGLDLEALKAQGMGALAAQGMDLEALKAKGMDLEALKAQGMGALPAQGLDLEALKAQGTALSAQGLDLEALKAKGMGALAGQGLDLEALKAQGMGALSGQISADKLKEMGLGSLSEVSPEKLKEMGLASLSGVSADKLKEMGLGSLSEVSPEKLKEMGLGALSGVSADKLKEMGLGSLSEVSPEKLKELGLGALPPGVSMDQLAGMASGASAAAAGAAGSFSGLLASPQATAAKLAEAAQQAAGAAQGAVKDAAQKVDVPSAEGLFALGGSSFQAAQAKLAEASAAAAAAAGSSATLKQVQETAAAKLAEASAAAAGATGVGSLAEAQQAAAAKLAEVAGAAQEAAGEAQKAAAEAAGDAKKTLEKKGSWFGRG